MALGRIVEIFGTGQVTGGDSNNSLVIDMSGLDPELFGEGYRVYRGRQNGTKLDLHIIVGTGDTLQLKGRYRAEDDWCVLGTYSADSNQIVHVEPPKYWMITRTAGSSSDTVVLWQT